MSELIFAVGLLIGFIIGTYVGWMNAKKKFKQETSEKKKEDLK